MDDLDYCRDTETQDWGDLYQETQLTDNNQIHTSPSVNFDEVLIDPIEIGFLPKGYWRPGSQNLNFLKSNYFQRRPTRTITFDLKLWNSLRITRKFPNLYSEIGVLWITPQIFKVNKGIFGKFVNIRHPTSSLYNSSGCFSTHGFEEVRMSSISELVSSSSIFDVDEINVRLYRHKNGTFNVDSNTSDLSKCKWEKKKSEKSQNDLLVEEEAKTSNSLNTSSINTDISLDLKNPDTSFDFN